MRQGISLLALTVVASSAIASNRFTTPIGAQAGDGANTNGVSQTAAAIGEKLTVDIIGTAIVETGAAIAAGALVQSDLNGKAITKAAGATAARMAPGEVATAAGQFVEVVLIQN